MRRIAPEVEAAILADARATRGTETGSVRQIAARHGVAHSTVRRIIADADDPGIDAPSARAKTENATRATAANIAAMRAELSELLLKEALRAARDMNAGECTVFNFGGKDNTFEMRKVPFVPTKDRQILATTAAICVDKHKVLDQYDSDAARGNAVDAWLAHMMGERPDGA